SAARRGREGGGISVCGGGAGRGKSAAGGAEGIRDHGGGGDHAEMEGSGARDRKPDRWQRRSVEHDGGRHGSDVRCEGGSGGRAGHGDWIPAISVEEGHDWNDAAIW